MRVLTAVSGREISSGKTSALRLVDHCSRQDPGLGSKIPATCPLPGRSAPAEPTAGEEGRGLGTTSATAPILLLNRPHSVPPLSGAIHASETRIVLTQTRKATRAVGSFVFGVCVCGD